MESKHGNHHLVTQWRSVCLQWHRFIRMDVNRVNYKVFSACLMKSNTRCKNWQFMFNTYMEKLDLVEYARNCVTVSSKSFCDKVVLKSMSMYVDEWRAKLDRNVGRNGNSGNKLRTYKLLKNDYKTEHFCKIFLPRKHKSALAKFRIGVAPIKLETGRYENISVDRRICPICKTAVECEKHVLLSCNANEHIRSPLMEKASHMQEFVNLGDEDKLIYILSNNDIVKLTAKTCYNMLQLRYNILYN